MSDWTPRVAELEAMVMYACGENERLRAALRKIQKVLDEADLSEAAHYVGVDTIAEIIDAALAKGEP